MADNLDPQPEGNQDPIVAQDPAPQSTDPVVQPETSFAWKDKLNPDFANSPTMKLFDNNVDGFNNAVKSHLELQKMLGHDKIPVPKGPDDVIAMDIYKKAFRIPAEPDGYKLPDVDIPESMKGVTMDKKGFASVIHRYNLTPEQAAGVWKEYTDMIKGVHSKYTADQTAKITGIKNEMMKEWGDAYETKVELGQMVINKFSDDQEMNDFVTGTLSQNPLGIKFLAKIGNQFAENKIGDFKYQSHTLSPEEAQKEIDTIRNDPEHPYNNPKASEGEHNRAVDYVTSLYAAINRAGTRGGR